MKFEFYNILINLGLKVHILHEFAFTLLYSYQIVKVLSTLLLGPQVVSQFMVCSSSHNS